MAKYCADCGEPMMGSKCSSCGWVEPKAMQEGPQEHGRCCVEVNGQRCPATGTSSDTTRADDGTKWYCRWHYAVKDYPSGEWVQRAQEIIDDLNQNHSRTLDWRDSLMREQGHY